jgi:hypothetical protein
MSYCRWSSNDWQCDVYVYEDARGGWTTHVAGRRRVFTEPLPAPVDLPRGYTQDQFDAWYARHRAVLDIVDRTEPTPIVLPHDGDTFNDPTPGDCADRLAHLRDLGYLVPDHAINELRTEQTETTTTPHPGGPS